MFSAQFMRFFDHLTTAQQGIIFHQEGEVIAHHYSPHHAHEPLLPFKQVFQEIEQTLSLIGEFKEGMFESEQSIWLICPLSSSLKLGVAIQRGSTLNQAQFWMNELILQINQSV